jgi:hypothetical protein
VRLRHCAHDIVGSHLGAFLDVRESLTCGCGTLASAGDIVGARSETGGPLSLPKRLPPHLTLRTLTSGVQSPRGTPSPRAATSPRSLPGPPATPRPGGSASCSRLDPPSDRDPAPSPALHRPLVGAAPTTGSSRSAPPSPARPSHPPPAPFPHPHLIPPSHHALPPRLRPHPPTCTGCQTSPGRHPSLLPPSPRPRRTQRPRPHPLQPGRPRLHPRQPRRCHLSRHVRSHQAGGRRKREGENPHARPRSTHSTRSRSYT